MQSIGVAFIARLPTYLVPFVQRALILFVEVEEFGAVPQCNPPIPLSFDCFSVIHSTIAAPDFAVTQTGVSYHVLNLKGRSDWCLSCA